MSNYHSFGHMKFIPKVSSEVFEKILFSNPASSKEYEWCDEYLKKIYEEIKKEIFAIEKPYT